MRYRYPEPADAADIAAQQDHREACFALTAWYLVGSPGVLPQSDTEAFLWAKKAADMGLAKAEYAVGYFSEVGIGTIKDEREAMSWFRKAAEHGDKRAVQRCKAHAQQQAEIARAEQARQAARRREEEQRLLQQRREQEEARRVAAEAAERERKERAEREARSLREAAARRERDATERQRRQAEEAARARSTPGVRMRAHCHGLIAQLRTAQYYGSADNIVARRTSKQDLPYDPVGLGVPVSRQPQTGNAYQLPPIVTNPPRLVVPRAPPRITSPASGSSRGSSPSLPPGAGIGLPNSRTVSNGSSPISPPSGSSRRQ